MIHKYLLFQHSTETNQTQQPNILVQYREQRQYPE